MSDIDLFDDYDDENDVDLNPVNKAPSTRVDRFKGEQDVTYRAALLYFHPLAKSLVVAAKRKAKKEGVEVDKGKVQAALDKLLSKRAEDYGKSVDELADWEKLDTNRVQFKKIRAHYKEGVGYCQSRLGKDGPDADKVWSILGDPKNYYYTMLLIYPTDREGNVDKELLLKRSVVKPWRFGDPTFNRLIQVDQKLQGLGAGQDLSNMDLSLKCKNSQFQNFEIDFCGAALWQKSAKLRDKFLPQAFALYEKMVDIREMSTQDVRSKLGIGGDSGEDVSDDEMEDFLEGV